ncbi:DNA primase [Vibrio phage phi 3]|uniref:DNA primase n=1 Tax=Vibrio phage phi 3 TaxID=1589298 RepID=A0A0B5H8Z4_9CAUD|nr:DNA primase [Vibrio phage phi 3]AJF40878.1 DNA primase [Vibrio phage phi 3]
MSYYESSVKALLDNRGVEYVDKGKDLLVRCINPEHDDSNPSMRIDSQTGKFNCFSCGHHGNIFLSFGEFRSPVYDLLYEVKEKVQDIQRETRGLDIPEGAIPFDEDFRGIRKETFNKFSAFIYSHTDYENRVIFPITDVTGKIVCFNGRHLYSNASPKYKVYPEKATLPIFPFIPNCETLILVEGLFDMANLQDKGITNVACIFGTQNLTYNNAQQKLLPFLISGVGRIILLLDNDKAGKYSSRKLVDLLRATCKVRVDDLAYLLPEGKDPGDLTQEEVTKLSKKLENHLAKFRQF